MSHVAIKRVAGESKNLSVFSEIAERLDAVQRRAFQIFETRGREFGHDLDDWLKAEHEILGWPAAELTEKDGAYEMDITLPGFEAKEIEVTAAPNEVIVHAAAEESKKTRKGSVLWTEFGSNDVYRRFEVPKAIEVDKVAVRLENGILKIIAPEAEKAKEVTVKAAAQ